MKWDAWRVRAAPGWSMAASTACPEEPFDQGEAHSVVKGDGDLAWGIAVVDCMQGKLEKIYDGGRIGRSEFLAARWDLIPRDKYMWASVQTLRGDITKHATWDTST